ncbi:phosphatase PAP2 family protein [Halorussus gelatinilyticus]|uniref:Phosphatase PAP2 family protein n=1 Tax=Halorussus gelatinilyticus TaxID=2937524 RepID=A0A8U0IP89_9EURY|nr:phosphatase PAP2 family protein [Halorussus gelatinilyticus]UPW01819.1 phosphatase PAP2 family protein [Halorussus gelatinilyticus]
MTRGIGETELLSGLPETATAVAGLVTQLGDMWFVMVGIGVVFVLGVRHRSVTNDPATDSVYLLALTVGAYSLTVALKHTFGLPRPPGAATATPPAWIPQLGHAVYESMVTGDGYGFPSGHALKTTVVYGGAALALDVWDRGRQLAVAGAIIALVAASRVVLGVHYVVDVVAGAVVGGLFLAAVVRLTDQRPTRTLALSTGLGLLGFLAAGTSKSALALAVAAVGLVVWVGTDRVRGLNADPAEH